MRNIKEALGCRTKTPGEIPVQVGRVASKTTSKGAPYFDVEIGDSTGVAAVKFWQDSQAFKVLKESGPGYYRLAGVFFKGDYGLECTEARVEALGQIEIEEFLAGGEEGAARSAELAAYLDKTISEMEVPFFKAFMTKLLRKETLRNRLLRAAAARKNHHARRGGLLAHTVSMLKVAQVVAGCYENVCADLLYCGVICHDIGKVVENDTGDGFAPRLSVAGEMLGHINIAIELVNKNWKECAEEMPEMFGTPEAAMARQHLLHLIASHHGTKEWGSPVTPKTPEALLLHAIDNMDAKMEMIGDVYGGNSADENGIFDGGRMFMGTVLAPFSSILKDRKSQGDGT